MTDAFHQQQHKEQCMATLHETPDSHFMQRESPLSVTDWIAAILLIVGGLNWGTVGLFGVDLVAMALGSGTTAARAAYMLVGIAALWGIFGLLRSR
jgi:uncharacterized membrane protein YuzA (DUF378 family)